MPNVASEVKVPSHQSLRPTHRPADRAEGVNPFSDLLDLGAPDTPPAPRQMDHPEPTQAVKKTRDVGPRRAAQDDCAGNSSDPATAPAAEVTPADSASVSQDSVSADTGPTDTTQDTAGVTLDASAIVIPPVAPAPTLPAAVIAVYPTLQTTDAPTAEKSDAPPAIAATAAADVSSATDAPSAADDVVATLPQPAARKTDAKDEPRAQSADARANSDEKPAQSDQSVAKTGNPAAAPEAKRNVAAQAPAEVAEAPKAKAGPRQPDIQSVTDTEVAARPAQAAHGVESIGLPLTSLHPRDATAIASLPSSTAIASAVPISGLAVEIAAQARAGGNRFEIRLDPPELGRIDVRLDVDKEGRVTSHLRVDRVETLDLLRRDAPSLERALQDAGLKTSDNALNFSLRDQSMHQHTGEQNMTPSATYVIADESGLTADAAQASALSTRLGGLDIRV